MWLLAFLALTLASLCGKYVESAKLPLEPSSSRGTCRIDDGEPFFCTLEYTANGCRLIDDKGQVRMAYTAVQCSERFEPAEDESTSVIRGNEGVFSVVSTDFVPPCQLPSTSRSPKESKGSSRSSSDEGSHSIEREGDMLGSGKESNRHQTSVNLDLETLEDKQPMQANEVLSEDPNERGGASEKDQRGPRAWEDASSDVDEADVHHDGQDDSSEKEENQTDHEKTKPVTEFGLAETNDKRTAREEAFSLGSVEEGDGLNPYESLISGQTSSDNPREPLEVLHVARHNPLQEDAESSQSEAEKRMSSNEEEDDDKEAKIESDHDESESKSDHESGEHEEYEEGRPIDDQQHPENLVQPSDTDLGAFEREKANEPHDEGTIHQPSAVPVSEVPIQPLVSEGGDKELYSEIPEISPNFKVNPLIKQPKVLNEDGSDEQDEQDDSQRRKTAAITAAPREKSPSRHLSSKLSKVTGAKIIIGDAKSDGEEEETISFVARTITLKNSIVTINKRVFEADGGKLSSLAINLGELEKIQVLLEITKEGLIVTSSKD